LTQTSGDVGKKQVARTDDLLPKLKAETLYRTVQSELDGEKV